MTIRVVNVTASNLRKLWLSPEQVCYVRRGGRFHKWPHHPLANPFKPKPYPVPRWLVIGNPCETNNKQTWDERQRAACLADYRAWLLSLPNVERLLGDVWEQRKDGELILGCWCAPNPCHADVIAEELHKRFVEAN